MMAMTRPTVLCFSGFDPTGGAGIQADIEAVAAAGCHALPVITALTDQDSGRFYNLQPVDSELMAAQIEHLLNDFQPAAIKVGLLAGQAALKLVSEVVQATTGIPVVVDPVLAAGGDGTPLGEGSIAQGILRQLLPFTTLATPNISELMVLATADHQDVDLSVDQANDPQETLAARLLADGCHAVLVTGTHAPGDAVVNRLYRTGEDVVGRSWPRLPGSYHGSGCTLASHIAGLLAKGVPLPRAVDIGQRYAWQTLERADKPGRDQFLPRRLWREEFTIADPEE